MIFSLSFVLVSNSQIENNQDGSRVCHLLAVSLAQSGEIKCTILIDDDDNTNSENGDCGLVRSAEATYTNLAVFPVSINSCHTNGDEVYVETNEEVDDVETTTAIRITQGPQDCTALIGGSVTLTVQFTGHRPTLKWLLAVSWKNKNQYLIVICSGYRDGRFM